MDEYHVTNEVIRGRVDYLRGSYSRGIYAFVKKQLKRWLHERWIKMRKPESIENSDPTSFKVILHKIEKSPVVACDLEVITHEGETEKVWRSSYYGHGPQDAITGCLHHLVEKKSDDEKREEKSYVMSEL